MTFTLKIVRLLLLWGPWKCRDREMKWYQHEQENKYIALIDCFLCLAIIYTISVDQIMKTVEAAMELDISAVLMLCVQASSLLSHQVFQASLYLQDFVSDWWRWKCQWPSSTIAEQTVCMGRNSIYSWFVNSCFISLLGSTEQCGLWLGRIHKRVWLMCLSSVSFSPKEKMYY